jgi:hypothetical protein
MADLKMNRLLDTIDDWASENGLDGEVDAPHRLAPTEVERAPPPHHGSHHRRDQDDRLPPATARTIHGSMCRFSIARAWSVTTVGSPGIQVCT